MTDIDPGKWINHQDKRIGRLADAVERLCDIADTLHGLIKDLTKDIDAETMQMWSDRTAAGTQKPPLGTLNKLDQGTAERLFDPHNEFSEFAILLERIKRLWGTVADLNAAVKDLQVGADVYGRAGRSALAVIRYRSKPERTDPSDG